MGEQNQEIVQLHALIEGRVQGVGFRYFVQEKAVAFGLTGWVRNRWDRTVEVVVEGNRSDVEMFLKALYRGPSAANVTNLKPVFKPATGEFSSFGIRLTR